MSYEDIKVTKQGNTATITIDRPNVLNAIRYHTMLEIDRALTDIEADKAVRVVVITGAGDKAFISGGDISVMAMGSGYARTLSEMPRGQEICARIENFCKPVVARINGIALGGSTEIALCCDIRIAVETAVMGFPEINLGIIPGYGGTQRLPRLVGVGKAKELILTGDHIPATEALKIGLVNKVAPVAELDSVIADFTRKLVSKSSIAMHMAKTAINNGTQTDLKTAVELEARCYSICFGSDDRIEGMNAFLEKRKPIFTDR